MYIIVQGLVEICMNYDKETAVIERLGIGTVLNPYNFVVEELVQMSANVATS